MAWARIDDDFFFHPKVSALLRNEHGWAALGFWIAGLSWAHKYTRKPGKTPGFLSEDDVVRMDPSMGCTFAGLLAKAGLWDLAEGGWMIHDFTEYLPSSAMSSSRREAGRKGGKASGAARAAAREQATSLESGATSSENEARAKQSPSMALGTGVGSSNSEGGIQVTVREDVLELCSLLADRIQANGSKRPTITKAWHDSCRLMLDRDGRSPAQVRKAIEWSQADEFWRGVVLSMPKLRQQYEKLRLAAQRNGHVSGKVAETLPLGVPEHMLRR